jgi:hypothetical protein
MDPRDRESPGARTMMIDTGSHDPSVEAKLRAANRRTALTLLSIALVFFVGVIATHILAGPATAIIVIGSAVLLFLVVAIGRSLRPGAGGGDDAAQAGGRGGR